MISVLAALLLAPLPSDSDWPGFRGPTGDGVAASASAPILWDRETNVRWRVDLSRPANGSPIVVNSRVFLTLPEDEDEYGARFPDLFAAVDAGGKPHAALKGVRLYHGFQGAGEVRFPPAPPVISLSSRDLP